MTHRPFKFLGRRILGWGQDDNGDLNSLIRTASDERKTMCLLCAILDEVREMNQRSKRIADNAKERRELPDPMAEGFVQAIRIRSGEIPIPSWNELYETGLPLRAMRAIDSGEFKFVNDIDRDSLLDIRNVGETTAKEVLAWRDSQLGGKA